MRSRARSCGLRRKLKTKSAAWLQAQQGSGGSDKGDNVEHYFALLWFLQVKFLMGAGSTPLLRWTTARRGDTQSGRTPLPRRIVS
jgi:hypothetical protein